MKVTQLEWLILLASQQHFTRENVFISVNTALSDQCHITAPPEILI